jgi:hypothetical protein
MNQRAASRSPRRSIFASQLIVALSRLQFSVELHVLSRWLIELANAIEHGVFVKPVIRIPVIAHDESVATGHCSLQTSLLARIVIVVLWSQLVSGISSLIIALLATLTVQLVKVQVRRSPGFAEVTQSLAAWIGSAQGMISSGIVFSVWRYRS